MNPFALPAGRWRSYMSGALLLIALSSQREATLGMAWVAACMAVAIVGVLAAAALGQRRYARAWVLVVTTLFLMAAAVFTFWAALTHWCPPVAGITCCYAGPIR